MFSHLDVMEITAAMLRTARTRITELTNRNRWQRQRIMMLEEINNSLRIRVHDLEVKRELGDWCEDCGGECLGKDRPDAN